MNELRDGTRTQLQLLTTAGLGEAWISVEKIRIPLLLSGLTVQCPHSVIFIPCPGFV
jgi:hypothetical protein